MQRKKRYTDKQKLAYYKKKALAAERTKYVKGRGDYKIPRNFFSAPKTGKMLGSMVGGWVAPGIGQEIGGMAGDYLGRQFKSITGWGDYAVKQNSLLQQDYLPPSFGEDTIRVRKREMIASINSTSSTGGFQRQTFDINPGLDTTFPWLSGLCAANYEQYYLHGLIFQFVSTSSDAIASTSQLGLGQVILATDYNASSSPFQDAPQMLGSMFSNSGKPSDSIMHAIECAPQSQTNKLYFIRSGPVPQGASILDYDYGKFTIALDNMPAAYQGVGQLWVTYDITFVKSVQNNQLGLDINTDFWLDLGQYTPTNANPFGTALSTKPIQGEEGSNLGCLIDNNSITFPPGLESGYYQVTAEWIGTAAAITAPTIARTGCQIVDAFFFTNTPILGSPPNGTTTSIYLTSFIVRLTGNFPTGTNAARLTFGSAVLPSAITRATLLITQVNAEPFDTFSSS